VPVKVYRLALREVGADEAADEAARYNRGRSVCKLASGQHRLQNSPSFHSNECDNVVPHNKVRIFLRTIGDRPVNVTCFDCRHQEPIMTKDVLSPSKGESR
jgi:hypothetical protein